MSKPLRISIDEKQSNITDDDSLTIEIPDDFSEQFEQLYNYPNKDINLITEYDYQFRILNFWISQGYDWFIESFTDYWNNKSTSKKNEICKYISNNSLEHLIEFYICKKLNKTWEECNNYNKFNFQKILYDYNFKSKSDNIIFTIGRNAKDFLTLKYIELFLRYLVMCRCNELFNRELQDLNKQIIDREQEKIKQGRKRRSVQRSVNRLRTMKNKRGFRKIKKTDPSHIQRLFFVHSEILLLEIALNLRDLMNYPKEYKFNDPIKFPNTIKCDVFIKEYLLKPNLVLSFDSKDKLSYETYFYI